jgi:hypothetical protein
MHFPVFCEFDGDNRVGYISIDSIFISRVRVPFFAFIKPIKIIKVKKHYRNVTAIWARFDNIAKNHMKQNVLSSVVVFAEGRTRTGTRVTLGRF